MARFSSYVDIVAAAIKEAYFKVGHTEGEVGDRFNTVFKSHLDDQLCHFLASLLETRAKSFVWASEHCQRWRLKGMM